MKSKLFMIEKLLNEKDIKLTSRRRAVLEVFLNHQEHIRVEDIYDILKTTGIGFATVYRTVELLTKAGIINEIMIDKINYYELKVFSEKCSHVHFKCKECKKVFDCDDPKLGLDIVKLRNYTEKTYGVNVDDLTIVMQGTCTDCKIKD